MPPTALGHVARYAEVAGTEGGNLLRVEKETRVKLTTDPEGRMTYGGNSGGAYRALPSRAVVFRHLRRSARWPRGAARSLRVRGTLVPPITLRSRSASGCMFRKTISARKQPRPSDATV